MVRSPSSEGVGSSLCSMLQLQVCIFDFVNAFFSDFIFSLDGVVWVVYLAEISAK